MWLKRQYYVIMTVDETMTRERERPKYKKYVCHQWNRQHKSPEQICTKRRRLCGGENWPTYWPEAKRETCCSLMWVQFNWQNCRVTFNWTLSVDLYCSQQKMRMNTAKVDLHPKQTVLFYCEKLFGFKQPLTFFFFICQLTFRRVSSRCFKIFRCSNGCNMIGKHVHENWQLLMFSCAARVQSFLTLFQDLLRFITKLSKDAF